MLVTIVAGARPNFVKIAPIIRAINQHDRARIHYRLVHTGQHYDQNMSASFFEDLEIPLPHINLESGSGSQAQLTANIMVRFEEDLLNFRPDVVLVVGDVTSTMACAITAKKLCIPVVHVEAGIRSGDMSMPEEVNRIVTDAISDHFFTTSTNAGEQLKSNGVQANRIHFVGNTMIDSLYHNLSRIKQPKLWTTHGLQQGTYVVLTLHRPVNVDAPEHLRSVLDLILAHLENLPVVFPIHPRTKKVLDSLSYTQDRLIIVDPFPYLEFMFMVKNAKAVITDSGGLSEETTVLNIPCMTLRDSTERPETVEWGSNALVGTDPNQLVPHIRKLLNGEWKQGVIPPLWDGKTSDRIVEKLLQLYAY